MSPPASAVSGPRPNLPARARSAARALVGLLLPVVCVGCGAWDDALCPRCEALLRAPLRPCEADALGGGLSSGPLPAWYVTEYAGAVRGIVLAWKRGADRDVSAAVARAARAAGAAWSAALVATEERDLVVVPAPSGWRWRAAGLLVVRTFAEGVATGLRAGDARPGPPSEPDPGERTRGRAVPRPPVRVAVADVLRRGGGTASQRGLGAGARAANRRRSMRLVAGLAPASSCLLVDDVLTTGATLAQARRTLEAAGHRVLGALVLAATPAPRSSR